MRVLKQWEQEEDTISACRLVLSACKLTDTDLEALSRICGESIFARSRADALRLQPNFAPGPPDAGCLFSLSAHNLTPPPPVRLERPPWLGLLCVSTDTFSSTVLLIDKGHEQRTYQFLFFQAAVCHCHVCPASAGEPSLPVAWAWDLCMAGHVFGELGTGSTGDIGDQVPDHAFHLASADQVHVLCGFVATAGPLLCSDGLALPVEVLCQGLPYWLYTGSVFKCQGCGLLAPCIPQHAFDVGFPMSLVGQQALC